MTVKLLFCEECGIEIINAQRKNQKYCRGVDTNCCKNKGNRDYMRKRNQTKAENFRGRYLKNG